MSTASASDSPAFGPETPGPGAVGSLSSGPQQPGTGASGAGASPEAEEPATRASGGHTAGLVARRRPKPVLVFDDPLDQQSADDTDGGWGERPVGGGDGDSAADLARFLDEKPPHHI